MEQVINELMETIMSNQLSVPVLQPILDSVSQLPMVGFLISFILWKPVFALLICPGLSTVGIVLLFFPWIERKLCARIQWRVGPREILPWLGGLIQLIADTLRFLFHEVIVHRDAHRPYFLQFPFLSFLAALLPLLFLNAGNVIAIETPYAIQALLALVCLFPFFILGLGWASNSRFAFIGTVREAFMYFAYEISFIIAVLAMIILYGTSNPLLMADKPWGIILNPIAAFTFFIGAAMATSRMPFEIPEADQEVAAGPHVEYSGIAFGLIYVMCYEKAYILSGLMVVLFLGGGSGPFIPGITPLLGDIMGIIWFLLKIVIVLTTLFVLRTIYPRYRLDQGLNIGWGVMISLSLIALALSIILVQGGVI